MKNKKTIILLLLIAIVGVVGLTLAYFANTASITNEFNTKQYGTTVTEVFESPENWTPGTTTPKTLTVTNSGQVDEAVRVSYTESWTSKNGDNLSLTQGDNRAAIINFSDNGDWTPVTENNKTYYYYNYKLAPNETTSTLLDSVTFNSTITNESNCVTENTATGKTVTCTSTGDGYDGASYKLVFKVETVQYDKYEDAWGTNAVIANTSKPSSGVNYLLSDAINQDGAQYNDASKSKMFKMSHPATEQTPAQIEYRYIGDSPNNYVKFNCDNDGTNCEIWRIIGVFDVDDGTGHYEQRIKLVRGSSLPDTKEWDTREGEMFPGENNGKNEWEGSLMQIYLNDDGDYYKRSGSASTYGLKTTAKNMISAAKYYLGGYYSRNGYGTADAIYLWERGSKVFDYENYCIYATRDSKCTTENYCENNPTDEICTATRNINWVGKVALMYPSDEYLVYANGVNAKCYSNPTSCFFGETSESENSTEGWIYKSNNLEGQNNIDYYWFVSPSSSKYNGVFISNSYGRLEGDSSAAYNYFGVRPVVYLKSSIKITNGDGSEQHPYELSL